MSDRHDHTLPSASIERSKRSHEYAASNPYPTRNGHNRQSLASPHTEDRDFNHDLRNDVSRQNPPFSLTVHACAESVLSGRHRIRAASAIRE